MPHDHRSFIAVIVGFLSFPFRAAPGVLAQRLRRRGAMVSRFIRDDHYAYHTELHRQHEEFAKLWDKNLRLQGFAEAFERQQHA